ncbi:hypothetical protein [Megasphaera elsdenii]|jgi:hypothetical protein|uniref:hypothetical protein n=1 Tax=Megasphaera elsdenii TaxID=907 RepID=UPI000920AF56|nr:hypothetical protein [Megasphaera elsdenii]SHK45176.1 hypothetical protein SAMN04488492_11352 [Megasphaera elsdenii]
MDENNEVMSQEITDTVTTGTAASIGPVIYIGPGFKDSRLNHGMIFAQGIPEPEANDDVLKHLFVTPSELNQAMNDVAIKGTALNTFYQEAVKRKKGGK